MVGSNQKRSKEEGSLKKRKYGSNPDDGGSGFVVVVSFVVV